MTTALPISNRIARIKRGDDPQYLGQLPSGYAILAKFQPDPIVGGCMLLPDPTPATLNDLDADARARFLLDLSILGDAVLAATGAEHLNYLILCNSVPELHGHVVPRYATEDPAKRMLDPFEAYDFGAARVADAEGEDAKLAELLRAEIERCFSR